MLYKLKQYGRFELSLLLAGMTFFCFILLTFRLQVTGTKMYIFLYWNLFLAFIPWAMSSLVMMNPILRERKFVLWGLLAVWMLFFPNSPYILTDLFHLRTKSAMPVWFDLGLVLSFAWTGLVYGFVSLSDIEHLLSKKFSRAVTSSVIVVLLFISSFGIYLGRYLRWNSWDIIHKPAELFMDIAVRFTDPFSHPRTWGMTILMGVLLNAMFWSIRFIKRSPSGL
jgi:uncharacterized membrane protein